MLDPRASASARPLPGPGRVALLQPGQRLPAVRVSTPPEQRVLQPANFFYRCETSLRRGLCWLLPACRASWPEALHKDRSAAQQRSSMQGKVCPSAPPHCARAACTIIFQNSTRKGDVRPEALAELFRTVRDDSAGQPTTARATAARSLTARSFFAHWGVLSGECKL
jgi:hypothetical protein